MAHHLYLTMCEHTASEGLSTYIWPCSKTLHWKGSALTFDHVWKHHIEKARHLHSTIFKSTASKGICTYIRPCSKTPHWKGSTLIFDHVRKHCIERALHLHSTMFKNIASEGLSVPDWGFLVTDQVPPFSQRMESTLISDQVGTHPSITSEWPYTYIWSCETTSHSHIRWPSVLDWVFLVTDQVPPFREWK